MRAKGDIPGILTTAARICAVRSHRTAARKPMFVARAVRHAEENSRRSVFCSDPLDLRSQAEVSRALRPDTPKQVRALQAQDRDAGHGLEIKVCAGQEQG